MIHENQYVRGNSQDCDQDQSNVVIQLGLTSKTCIVCHKVHYSGLSIWEARIETRIIWYPMGRVTCEICKYP